MDKEQKKLLGIEDEPKTHLDIMLHPTTRIFCTKDGVVSAERYNADPFPFGSTPKQSRKEAKARCEAAFQQFKDPNDPGIKFRISSSGNSDLTYAQLQEQVERARIESKRYEVESEQRFQAKREKYNV